MPVTLAPEELVYTDQQPPVEPPPEQAPPPPPPEQAPPPPPPPEQAPTGGVPLDAQSLTPGAGGPVPSPGLGGAPAPEAQPGPLEQAANALGQQVAPIIAQAPEPVQNLANIVGQPVGGAIEAAQNVADQGTVAGTIGAGLGALSGPQQRGKEQAGERVAQGLPANPGAEATAPQGLLTPLLQPLADTGVGQAIGGILSAPLPGTSNLPAPPTAAGAIAAGPDPGQALASLPGTVLGTGIDDWAKANPDAVQQAYQIGGGAAVVDAYVKQLTHAPEGAAPPQFVNPFDNTTGNTLERAVQVAGNIPRAIGGVVSSGKQGTLVPFLEEQALQTAMDPTVLIPGELTGHLAESAGTHIRALPGVRTLIKPAESEVARLAGEQAVSHAGEYIDAARRQAEFEAANGITPAGGPAPAAGETIVQQMSMGGEDTYRLVSPTRGLDYPTLEAAVAANPSARVLPTRAEMVQQFETSLPDIVGPDGRIDPINEQRLRDGISMQNPAAFGPAEAAAIRRRQGVRSAYDATPPEFQRTVEERLATDDHLYHGVTLSREAAGHMNDSAAGALRFRDGWQPRDMTLGEVADRMRSDSQEWLDGFNDAGVPDGWTQGSSRQARAWRTLNDRLNADGQANILEMKGDVRALDAHTTRVFEDAVSKGLPAAKRTAMGRAFGSYTNAIRQAMLFNVLNVPRYMAQNLLTNTLNIVRRGGGPRVAWDVLTNIKENMRVFGNQRDGSPTLIDALEARTGQSRPNIRQTQRPYFDRIAPQGSALSRLLNIPLRIIAPETGRFLASTPDIRAREAVAAHAIFEGYKDLNARMPEVIHDTARRHSPSLMPAPGKAAQVFKDFTDQFRTLEDPKTGKPRTGLLGGVDTYEPTWHPEELRPYLKEHLFEDMAVKPNPGQMNRIVNEVLGTSRDEVRKIWDDANATTDSALFSWRNTKGDELLGQATLFHYWMTRQGGFYVSEMMKHPWVAAAYGRMMGEMQQQNEDLGGPAWLTGFFQFQQSVGGFSTFLSPFDLVQSLLTFADWQTDPGDPNRFEDLTKVGQVAKNIPFFIHPAITFVAYELGMLGPDARPPDPLGVGTFGVNAINLLNLANAQGAPFMQVFNKMGIGVDAQGNKIPIAPRPLQDLIARTGNAISSALEPITGLSPVEVTPSWASMVTDVQTIGEQEVRKAHPEWDDGSKEGQMQIDGLVTAILADPGNPEYQRWYGLAAQEPYQLGAGVPQPLAGLLRIASPIQVRSMPEQRALDTMEGLTPSGNAPMRGAPDPQDPNAAAIFNEGKYAKSKTIEGQLLTERVNEYANLGEPAVSQANTAVGQLIYHDLPDGAITIGGQTYTNDQLAAMDYDTRQGVINAYLAEQGVTEDQLATLKADREQFLAAHPDVAAYNAYKGLIRDAGGAQAFTDQMRQTNPSFAQYVQSQMVDHTTGQISEKSYNLVYTTDAFLASQGVRPSVYSSLVGNEPSTAKGGYPSIPGVEPGQPILPSVVNTAADTYLYASASDVDRSYYDKPPLGVVSPTFPLQALEPPRTYTSSKGVQTRVVKVSAGTAPDGTPLIGYVDASLLTNTSPPRPAGGGQVQQPGGGLTEAAGGVVNTLGSVKDALGQAVGSVMPTLPTPSPPAAIDTSTPAERRAAYESGQSGGNALGAIGTGLGGLVQGIGDVAGATASGLSDLAGGFGPGGSAGPAAPPISAAPAPAPSTGSPGSPNTYTTADGTTYHFLHKNGTPVTPNYGYFQGSTAVPDNPDGTRALPPKYIVYHYTAGDSIDDFIGEFMGSTNRASSNFVLDKDGTLYTLVPDTYSAWANGDADMLPADVTPGTNLNQESISIEIVNTGSEPYTPAQIATLQRWTADETSKYGIAPDHLIGHSDVTSYKSDPGTYFPWDTIRASAQGMGPAA